MIKVFWDAWKTGRLIAKTIKQKRYYTHIDNLPVYNFAQIMKGKYQFLWIDEKYHKKKYPECLFKQVFQEMYFQFKYLDNLELRDKAAIAEYNYKFATTNNYRWRNESTTLQAKLKTEVKGEFDLNDFTDYIEHTFKNPVGSIDVRKISTSKAFNNYHRAIELNKKHHGNNK